MTDGRWLGAIVGRVPLTTDEQPVVGPDPFAHGSDESDLEVHRNDPFLAFATDDDDDDDLDRNTEIFGVSGPVDPGRADRYVRR